MNFQKRLQRLENWRDETGEPLVLRIVITYGDPNRKGPTCSRTRLSHGVISELVHLGGLRQLPDEDILNQWIAKIPIHNTPDTPVSYPLNGLSIGAIR
jgi:hypothetical protein